EAGIAPQDVLIFGGVVVMALLLVVVAFTAGANRTQERMKRITLLAQKARPVGAPTAISVKRSTADSSIATVDYLIKRWLPNPQKMRSRLLRTGRSITLGQYLTFCFFLVGLTAVLLKLLMPVPFIACFGIGIVAGIGVPHMVVGMMGKRRQNK